MTAKRGLTISYLTLLIGQSNLYLKCLRILGRSFFLVKMDHGENAKIYLDAHSQSKTGALS
jgi:hypothetical protein